MNEKRVEIMYFRVENSAEKKLTVDMRQYVKDITGGTESSDHPRKFNKNFGAIPISSIQLSSVVSTNPWYDYAVRVLTPNGQITPPFIRIHDGEPAYHVLRAEDPPCTVNLASFNLMKLQQSIDSISINLDDASETIIAADHPAVLLFRRQLEEKHPGDADSSFKRVFTPADSPGMLNANTELLREWHDKTKAMMETKMFTGKQLFNMTLVFEPITEREDTRSIESAVKPVSVSGYIIVNTFQ